MSATQGYYLEDLEPGMAEEKTVTITEEHVNSFAELSGDFNPIHMDEEFAKTTPFGARIAHGALTASFISAVLGNQIPGPGAIFIGLNLRFRRPVLIGQTVTARAEVNEINQRTGLVKMKCACLVEGKRVLAAEASVIVPRRPSED